jgi:cell division protein FtsQ
VSLDRTLPRARRFKGGRRGGRTERTRGARVRLPRIPLKPLLAVAVVAVILGAGWMWFRDSSLVRVRDIQVTGATSSERNRVISALEAAARNQSTLHVREAALRAAAGQFDSVAGIQVKTDFPHGMRIEVLERHPVAALEVGDQELAATGDGRLLRGVVADGALPMIRMDGAPAGDRVTNRNTRTALAIAAAAPPALRSRIDRLWTGPKGMMLALVDGPDLIFGDAVEADRKWLSASRVLADPSAAGATYLDVRIPERVAAGGLGPVAEPTPEATPETNPQP